MMETVSPGEQRSAGSLDSRTILQRVVRLEFVAIALTLLSILVRLTVVGSSVAMLAAILEDLTELVAPIAVLLSLRLENRPADSTHPFGYQRVGSLSFFSASLALLLLGVLTCWQGAEKLLAGGVRAYGDLTLGGVTFWMGWAMIGVLVATSAMMLPVLNAKRALSRQVGSAALQTDAASNQAHIMVALTAALGVLLTYFGWSWADPTVAIAVGGVILSDGWRDLRVATAELIDATPEVETMEQLSRVVAAKPYVESHYWLARKVGRFIDADLLVAAPNAPLAQVDDWRKELEQELRAVAWQLHDLTISFGVELPLAKYEDGPRNAAGHRQ